MGMPDGRISIRLVGGEERYNCIVTPFHDVSDARIYSDIANSENPIETWAYGPSPPLSMATLPLKSLEYLRGSFPSTYGYTRRY